MANRPARDVFEQLFPSERNANYVQTDWARDWSAGAAGYGSAAEFLTKHRRRFNALIDQAGLAVIFLQRHRVELCLKDLLTALGVDFPNTHSLRRLWELCERGFAGVDGLDWKRFEAEHGEFIAALALVDDMGATFRYPVDRERNEMSRPEYIDLDALNHYSDDLYWGVAECIATVEAGYEDPY